MDTGDSHEKGEDEDEGEDGARDQSLLSVGLYRGAVEDEHVAADDDADAEVAVAEEDVCGGEQGVADTDIVWHGGHGDHDQGHQDDHHDAQDAVSEDEPVHVHRHVGDV